MPEWDKHLTLVATLQASAVFPDRRYRVVEAPAVVSEGGELRR
jgi:hypothetical protein